MKPKFGELNKKESQPPSEDQILENRAGRGLTYEEWVDFERRSQFFKDTLPEWEARGLVTIKEEKDRLGHLKSIEVRDVKTGELIYFEDFALSFGLPEERRPKKLE